ncbi:cytochrome P450 [Calocera cornea HHB12733]|uniref:Cytochrome P450 n=1 Tax=Calocera cornea HHB12733 TaxID=1353952 RepID=A0A165GU14_9BASI|nr:cytochrome P450 [Calocera cornea HHB12733]
MFNPSLGLLVLLLALLVAWDVLRKQSCRLPSGPPGLPLLGNLLQLPSTYLFRKLHAWSHEYGPLYTIWMGTQPFVVLGSAAVAADVLDRLSAVTSDRPPMIKARQFFFRDMILVSQDHTPMWRAQRRAIHANFNIRAATSYNLMQEQEAACLALRLLRRPDKPFRECLHRFGASVIFRSCYGGQSIQHLKIDPTKRIDELTEQAMHATAPQRSVVDTLPILNPLICRVKWFRRQADKWFTDMEQEAIRLYDAAVSTDGFDATTLVHDVNTNMEKYGMTKHDAMWMTMTLFMAGQETTDTTLCIFVLAMLHYPEVAQEAQRQLDAVCGDFPPTFEDRAKLPYLEALLKETTRWKPGVPLSIPHMASEDFEYKGYTFKKGTVFLDNLWSQTRDPHLYRNPELFDPSRFLDDSGNLLPINPDTRADQLAFGHGRRVCVGRDFALNTMFIACAYLLWAFRLEWPRDEHGSEVICGVDDFRDTTVTVSPRDFGIVPRPRKEGLEERLLAALKEHDIID